MTEVIEIELFIGRPFAAAGNESTTRYPNLVELHKYYPCGEPAVCDHAGIEPELLHAVLYNGKRLKYAELLCLAGLYCCPVSVLTCPKVIMLDTERPRHRKMIAKVDNLYTQLKCMAREGNQKAERWLELTGWVQQRFLRAAYNKNLSYCHDLGVREQLRQYISFSTPSPKRRGLSPVKGGVA